jgi:dienelactone hydrolase
MRIANPLWKNSIPNVSRQTPYIPRPNRHETRFSSTCAVSRRSPYGVLNFFVPNDFRLPPTKTRILITPYIPPSSPLRVYGRFASLAVCTLILCLSLSRDSQAQQKSSGPPLPNTAPLTLEGDIAAQMVAGIDKFLLRELDLSVERREKHWNRDFSSPEAYNKSIEPNRQRLKKILGLVDDRVPFDAPELVASVGNALRGVPTPTRSASEGRGAGVPPASTPTQSVSAGHPLAIARGENYEIFAVRWPAVRQVHGEGLLLVPKGETLADIIAIPDADQTPEQICGLADGVPAESQFARRLAENGCRVLVPTLISREMSKRSPPGMPGRANLTNREFVYRPAFELGRHLIGYELQKVLAGVDWFEKEANQMASGRRQPPDNPKIGVIGYGEGGMLALYAGAVDARIDQTCVSGYFGPREDIWEHPIDRNGFGLLEQFGDAELAAMVGPRKLFIQINKHPEISLPSEGGAPALVNSPSIDRVNGEFQRLAPINKAWQGRPTWLTFIVSQQGEMRTAVSGWRYLVSRKPVAPAGNAPESSVVIDRASRQQRQIDEILRDTQHLLAESPYVRQRFLKKLTDTKSVEEYEKVAEEYREFFATEVIGRFDYPLEPPNPKSRQSYETEKWTGYEVVLDVFPDVFAYGILCLPKDIKPGERRPVVVCQHGLEGRPQDVVGEQRQEVYAAFAGKLADRGFITFAPQNIYIGKDNFRTLQRKANPLGKTLFSIMVPQHQQICNWLKSLDCVDGDRIAFYGLSYGGKSAMRIPPLVKDYCLSICSADFNDWVDKCASTRAPYSYVWTGEYEIFEFDLGSTFNYAEMAALIAPRPFMVERGHFDGVGVDERVAAEYAKVQRIYAVQLKLPERCQIEYFVGPHKINGVGTYDFLHKHLNWPKSETQ